MTKATVSSKERVQPALTGVSNRHGPFFKLLFFVWFSKVIFIFSDDDSLPDGTSTGSGIMMTS